MSELFLQQTFDLSIKNKKTFDNFICYTNHAPKDMLKQYLDQSPGSMILLFGEYGSGKTHLLRAACYHYQSLGGKATYISLKRPTEIEKLLTRKLSDTLVCIDDIHLAAGHTDLEHILFKFYNHAEIEGCTLVWAQQTTDPFLRKDLQSRLHAMLKIDLKSYTPTEILSILLQYLRETQSSIPASICEHLIKHYTRNIPRLLSKLKEIEDHAHSLQKKVTLKMCKELIEDLHQLGESV